jgi:hypothetical protein
MRRRAFLCTFQLPRYAAYSVSTTLLLIYGGGGGQISNISTWGVARLATLSFNISLVATATFVCFFFGQEVCCILAGCL